ncbi:MAG: sulfotransferase [Dokdonella sp.]
MKLPVPFVQLPLRFDAQALLAEVERLDQSLWRPHPTGMPGNSALPLVTSEGDPARGDWLVGPMRPTPELQRSPYLMQVLASLEAVIGRVRLMRLSGGAEVHTHVDTDYYWNERVRVHVPILTQPSVRFSCADAQVNMAAGECWIFDTWRMHHVLNDNDSPRIHMVVDSVGSAAFWDMVNAGRPHTAPRAGWQPRLVGPPNGAAPVPIFESINSQSPMSYWELRGHVSFLFGEVDTHPRLPAVAQMTGAFVGAWQSLWYAHGADAAGLPQYARLLDDFLARVAPAARGIPMRNGADLADGLTGMFKRAVARTQTIAMTEEGSRSAPVQAAPMRTAVNVARREFERPVFIISPPRSGSSLFFETLARSPTAHTIGGESHGIFEGIAALDTARAGYASNRLDAAAATPEVADELRARFAARVFDRDRNPPAPGAIRLLEKTPKNALRVPFLREVFPDAMFVYLYRDPREVLASMLEAWESGAFRTYAQLPGWTGLPWSLLLTPGWRDLIGQPLPQIVATQWAVTTRVLLDDLEQVPAAQRCVARYDALIADPAAEAGRICTSIGFAWDQPLGTNLPLASHTVSAPQSGKWRRREQEVLAALAGVEETAARAARFAQR